MRRLAVVTLVVLAANALPRAAQAQTPVPRALEDWQAWVLKGREFHRCPFLAGSNPAVAESYRCAWPSGCCSTWTRTADVSVSAGRSTPRAGLRCPGIPLAGPKGCWATDDAAAR